MQRKTNEKRLREEIQKAKEEKIKAKDANGVAASVHASAPTVSGINSQAEALNIPTRVKENKVSPVGNGGNFGASCAVMNVGASRPSINPPISLNVPPSKATPHPLSVTEMTRQVPAQNSFSHTNVSFPMPTPPKEINALLLSHQSCYQEGNQATGQGSYANAMNPYYWNNFQFKPTVPSVTPICARNVQLSPGIKLLLSFNPSL